MRPFCFAFVLLFLGVATDATLTWNDPACGWNCDQGPGYPVCGSSYLHGRQAFKNFCALQQDACLNQGRAYVPAAYGRCPSNPLAFLDCSFECPPEAQQVTCAINFKLFSVIQDNSLLDVDDVREFGSLCQLVRYNCRNPFNMVRVVPCPEDD